MKPKTSPPETALIAACLALVLLALQGPVLLQPADHHHFADQRTLWGIPCAWDVLSNLPFAMLGPLSVQAWAASGNVLAWCVLQFGGMALMLWLAALRPVAGALGLRLGAILLIYTAAKALELADHPVFDLTGQFVSGHTLKHLVASLAALLVIAALKGFNKCGQNPAAHQKTKVAPARRLGNA